MVLAVASSNGNAPTTSDDHAASLRSPMLLNYQASTPPLAEHLLLDMPQHSPKGNDEDDASAGKRKRKRRVDWASVCRACGEWLSNPMNVALVVWLLCVGVSGGMLVLLLLGLLDGAFPAAAERNRWIEINNQFLNGLFTLLSLYQHPTLCHHTFLLCRWRPADAVELRDAYCNGNPNLPRPAERAHMAVVVALLHLTLACQYVTCGLYWGYTDTARPDLLADGFFVLGIVAPLAAAVYAVSSPLGKDSCHDLDDAVGSSEETKQQPVVGHVVVLEPEWSGGMFTCGGGEASTWWLSLSCTFCVFGWNMERLGFGNAFVHAATFALLCLAPIWVLGVSALHIHDYLIGDAVGAAGVLLCAGGLLYGGYWRIQMRNRFGLPGSRACCGSKSLTDYARWLFCWPLALAQEVRTANLYHVDGELFYYKQVAVAHDDHHATSIVEPLLLVGSGNDHHRDVFRATETVVAVSQQADAHHLVVVVDDETTMAPPPVQVVIVQQAVEEEDAHLSQASQPDAHHLVVTVDDQTAMAPPPVQVVVVQQAVEDDKSGECSVSSLHGESETVDSSIPISVPVSEEEDAPLLVQAGHDSVSSSDGSTWRVEKVKKLINMVTLVSLLILLYTRGLIL